MFKNKYTFLIFQYGKYALQAVDITQETDTLPDRLKYTVLVYILPDLVRILWQLVKTDKEVYGSRAI